MHKLESLLENERKISRRFRDTKGSVNSGQKTGKKSGQNKKQKDKKYKK